MSAPEYPPNGGSWLGNAEVYERHRQDCLDMAESAERQGDAQGADEMRRAARSWSKRRDHEQRLMEMRQVNRRAHRGF